MTIAGPLSVVVEVVAVYELGEIGSPEMAAEKWRVMNSASDARCTFSERFLKVGSRRSVSCPGKDSFKCKIKMVASRRCVGILEKNGRS